MNPDKLDYEVLKERIRQLEDVVMNLTADIQDITGTLQEAQQIIVKLVTSQQQVIERVSSWPYVKVPKSESE